MADKEKDEPCTVRQCDSEATVGPRGPIIDVGRVGRSTCWTPESPRLLKQPRQAMLDKPLQGAARLLALQGCSSVM